MTLSQKHKVQRMFWLAVPNPAGPNNFRYCGITRASLDAPHAGDFEEIGMCSRREVQSAIGRGWDCHGNPLRIPSFDERLPTTICRSARPCTRKRWQSVDEFADPVGCGSPFRRMRPGMAPPTPRGSVGLLRQIAVIATSQYRCLRGHATVS